MSELAQTATVKQPSWRSIPELTASDTSAIWWFLLAFETGPIWLIVRTGGETQSSGLFWLYAGSVGVFVVIRRQYERVLTWRETFDGFVTNSDLAEEEISSFARRRWHLHPSCIVFCATFTAGALAVFRNGGLFDYPSRVDCGVAIGFVAIASYICGLGLSAVFHMVRLVRHLGSFDLYVSPHPFGILNVGRLLTRVFLETAAVWCLYTASSAACPRSWLMPSMSLALPAVLFFAISFFAAQVPLHRSMREYKQQQVKRVEQALRSIDPPLSTQISEEDLRHIEFLEKRLQALLTLPEWPFRWPSFLTVVGSAAATLISPVISAGLARTFDVAFKP